MFDMFSFLFAGNNRNERIVDHYEEGDLIIDTCSTPDGHQTYETAVMHVDYRENGKLVIVEAYDTREEAQVGHDSWVRVMTTKPLPDKLVDCCNALLLDLGGDEFKESLVYPRKRGGQDVQK